MSRTYNHKPARVYEPDGLYEYNEDFAEAYHKNGPEDVLMNHLLCHPQIMMFLIL